MPYSIHPSPSIPSFLPIPFSLLPSLTLIPSFLHARTHTHTHTYTHTHTHTHTHARSLRGKCSVCGKQLAPASTFPTDQYKKLLDQCTAVLDREPDCFQENRKEVAELRVYKQMMGSYRPFRAVIDGLNIAYVDNSCNINNVRAHIHMYVYCVCVHNMCMHVCVCVCVCVCVICVFVPRVCECVVPCIACQATPPPCSSTR